MAIGFYLLRPDRAITPPSQNDESEQAVTVLVPVALLLQVPHRTSGPGPAGNVASAQSPQSVLEVSVTYVPNRVQVFRKSGPSVGRIKLVQVGKESGAEVAQTVDVEVAVPGRVVTVWQGCG